MEQDIKIYERLVRLETKLDTCLEHLTRQNGRIAALEQENDIKENELWKLKETTNTHNRLLKVVLGLLGATVLIQIPEAGKLLGILL